MHRASIASTVMVAAAPPPACLTMETFRHRCLRTSAPLCVDPSGMGKTAPGFDRSRLSERASDVLLDLSRNHVVIRVDARCG